MDEVPRVVAFGYAAADIDIESDPSKMRFAVSANTSLHLPVTCLRLAFFDPGGGEILSDGGRLHFLIKLDELQFQDLMGRVHKPNSPDNAADVTRVQGLNTPTFQEIPMHLLAAFFYTAPSLGSERPTQGTSNIRTSVAF